MSKIDLIFGPFAFAEYEMSWSLYGVIEGKQNKPEGYRESLYVEREPQRGDMNPRYRNMQSGKNVLG